MTKIEQNIEQLTIARDVVVNDWDLPYGGTEDVEVLEDEITGTSRWSIQHRLIVRIKEKVYQAFYQEGATEQQCEQPWEYDKDVTFVEVCKVPKTIEVWEVKQKENQ